MYGAEKPKHKRKETKTGLKLVNGKFTFFSSIEIQCSQSKLVLDKGDSKGSAVHIDVHPKEDPREPREYSKTNKDDKKEVDTDKEPQGNVDNRCCLIKLLCPGGSI